MRVTLRPLREADRAVAADLYWQAFQGKLGRILCPAPKAMQFLRNTMYPPACLAAVDASGRVLGVAGCKTLDAAFICAGPSDLRDVYGGFGAYWRGVILDQFDRPARDGTLWLDGICVAPDRRGQGIGTCLLEGVIASARDQRLDTVLLDVAANNPRARALYERHGFTAAGVKSTGWAAPIIGFGKYTTMIRQV